MRPLLRFLLRQAPAALFVLTLLVFGLLTPRFLEVRNLANIVVQAAPTGLVAIGMTFVLLTAGVDLSVGAIMFVAAAVAGKLLLAGHGLAPAMLAMLGVGLGFGALNGLLVTRCRVPAFVVTLALLFVGRGFALWLTETRAMNLPAGFLAFGSARVLGLPLPLVVFALVAVVSHVLLTRTTFGRHIYAVGHGEEIARKAGIATRRVIFAVYAVSGGAAALGAVVSLGQLGAVTPKFGENYEFKAIAAAVLGGTSLFGGRGAVLPGTVLGALLIQSVENGQVLLNADPYSYPLVTSAIIFAAVLLDRARTALLARETRRSIRREPGD